jgi:vacuolar-type H+-ATPase subunit E/Vma4
MRETYTARAAFLDRVFDAVHVRLAEAALPDTYDSALAQHLVEALAYLPDEPVIVRCPPLLEQRVRALTNTRSNVTVAVDAAAPLGISVEARDGSVTVDNTLASRVERLRPLLNMELLQRLGSGA